MSFDRFVSVTRRRIVWLPIIGLACLVFALLLYGALSDRYVTDAVVTARANEDRGFDTESLGGLAALAGGGQRPSFEQLSFLVQSEPIILRLLPTLRRTSSALVGEMLARSSISETTFGFEQSARSMFGKPPKVLDSTQQLVTAIRARLKIDKTPEGYLKISFTARTADGQLALVGGLLREADAMIRAREQVDYQARVRTYQSLVETQTRATERAVLVSLIGREFSTYVAAQSGQTFSYIYVEPPLAPKRLYSLSLLTLCVLAVFASFVLYIGFVLVRVWAGD